MSASSSLRARPSPCSPDSDPPSPTTSLAASRRKLRKTPAPSGCSSRKSRRAWTQPSPKCPYGMQVRPYPATKASNARRYSPRRLGGTAASSQPAWACSPAGDTPLSPAPSARTCQSAAACAASWTTRWSIAPIALSTATVVRSPARASASAAVSPTTSTKSQPSPRGRAGTAAAPRRSRTAVTIRESRPSQAVGWCASTSSTASAALARSANPRTTRRVESGARTSRTVALVTRPSVPSLPTRARATSNPCSGSRCSSA